MNNLAKTPKLDPDNIHMEIHCVACKEPLWSMKILKRIGSKVASTEHLPLSENVPSFSNKRHECPLCGMRYFTVNKKNGVQSYLLKDVASGLLQLI